MRGESESDRSPMLLFEFVRLLFKFNADTPALEALFQFPDTIGDMLRRYPLKLLLPIKGDPAANHST